ncbi:hypothetical protein GCM10009545_37880 [Saccharopolyspora thermophila]|uniref:VOC domain-containing protein n=2 Tax=Saccharopolyspora thermophila TaxID=89367 RepID=A0ABN1D1V7_9PSEU
MTDRNGPDFSRMTDAELADWQYEHRDELDAKERGLRTGRNRRRTGLRGDGVGWGRVETLGMEVLNSRLIVRPRDRQRSLRFYRDVLGLAIAREFPGGTVFFLGQGFLELSGQGGPGPSPDQVLWLQVRDLAAEFDRLRAAGVTVLAEPARQPWGLDEGWITDPDGMRIVLVEVPAEHPMRADLRKL